jgi:hypothetical protein
MQLRVLRAMLNAPTALAVATIAATILIPDAVTIQQVGGASTTAGFHEPDARAAALDLPKPATSPISTEGECAVALADDVPVACFARPGDAMRYINGELPGGGHQIKLTGTGGTQLSASSGWHLGTICISAGAACGSSSSNRRHLYVPDGGGSCTHTYIQNDYYRNYTGDFNTFSSGNYWGSFYCGFIGVYLNDTQGGTGATGHCVSRTSFSGNFGRMHRSISFSYTSSSC